MGALVSSTMRSGHLRSEWMRIVGPSAADATVLSLAGGLPSIAAQTNSSATKAPPTYAKYRSTNIRSRSIGARADHPLTGGV
jgi:hypothetical protein